MKCQSFLQSQAISASKMINKSTIFFKYRTVGPSPFKGICNIFVLKESNLGFFCRNTTIAKFFIFFTISDFHNSNLSSFKKIDRLFFLGTITKQNYIYYRNIQETVIFQMKKNTTKAFSLKFLNMISKMIFYLLCKKY